MIKIILAYLAIGMLMTIRWGWDDLMRRVDEYNLSMPLVVLIVIAGGFIVPIAFVCGIIMGIVGGIKDD